MKIVLIFRIIGIPNSTVRGHFLFTPNNECQYQASISFLYAKLLFWQTFDVIEVRRNYRFPINKHDIGNTFLSHAIISDRPGK